MPVRRNIAIVISAVPTIGNGLYRPIRLIT